MTIHPLKSNIKKTDSEATGVPSDAHLPDNEAFIQTLLDMNKTPSTVNTVADNQFILVNQSWCEMTGFQPKEVIGRTPRNLGIGLDSKNQSEMIQTLRQQGHMENIEARYVIKDGRTIQAQLSTKIIVYRGKECLLTNITLAGEQTDAPKELQNNQSRYHNILNSLAEPYYETDLKGKITFFHDALLETPFSSRSREELMGMNFREFMLPEDVQRVHDAYQEVHDGACVVKYVEFGLSLKNGNVAYLETSVSLLRDDTGHPIGFYGTIRDRTEHKKAEMALRKSEESHRRILDEMEEGYYETDLKGTFTYLNRATLKTYGLNAEELVGRNVKDITSSDRLNMVTELFAECYRTGKPIRIDDYEIIRPDGSVSYNDLSGYPLKDENGQIVGFWGIIRDRTQQRKAELAIGRSEEKYRNILESMNEGYYEFDMQGNFTDFNNATLVLHGRSADELKGLSYTEYSYPEEYEKNIQIFSQMYQTGEPVKLHDLSVIRKDGTVRHIETSVYLRQNEQGETDGFWGISRDRTEQKMAEIALKESEEQYRLLVENASDAIYITQDGCIKYHKGLRKKVLSQYASLLHTTFGRSSVEKSSK